MKEFWLWLLGFRKRVRVNGDSMCPTIRSGDEVLVDTRAYFRRLPREGEVVIAKHPYKRGVSLIKRIALVEDSERIYLAGDNKSDSTDSDSFGSVLLDHVVGLVTGKFA
jgi:nickel-type superoxide dismutase maturation protease